MIDDCSLPRQDLYGPSANDDNMITPTSDQANKSKSASAVSKLASKFSYTICDKLFNTGPIADMAIGEAAGGYVRMILNVRRCGECLQRGPDRYTMKSFGSERNDARIGFGHVALFGIGYLFWRWKRWRTMRISG